MLVSAKNGKNVMEVLHMILQKALARSSFVPQQPIAVPSVDGLPTLPLASSYPQHNYTKPIIIMVTLSSRFPAEMIRPNCSF